MAKKKEEENSLDFIWVLMLLSLLFYEPPKQPKVINIYMGDEE